MRIISSGESFRGSGSMGSGILDFMGIPAPGRPKPGIADRIPGILGPPKLVLPKPFPIAGPELHGVANAGFRGRDCEAWSSESCTAAPSAGGFDLEFEDCKNRRWACEGPRFALSRCQQKTHTDCDDCSFMN